MRSLIVKSANDWIVTELPAPVAEEDEVVIAISASGICGTDIHTLRGTNTSVNYPITPGHEFGGVVVSFGKAIKKLKIGDRVVVNPSRTCGHCKFCLGNKNNLCPTKGGYGAKYPGGFREFVAIKEDSCALIPENMSWKTALLAEPMACVLTGLKKIPDCQFKNILVVGGGPIGALMAWALLQQSTNITVIEPVESRRILISQLGISHVLNPDQLPIDVKWDVVIDATGNSSVIQKSLELVESGGTFLIMGVTNPKDQITFSPQFINRWEITITGSFSINDTFQNAIDLLSKSNGSLELLITNVFDLNNFKLAIEAMSKQTTMKILVTCSGEILK